MGKPFDTWGELERFAVQLGAIAGPLEEVCERLAVGIDTQAGGQGNARGEGSGRRP
jgi:hypothetical protein